MEKQTTVVHTQVVWTSAKRQKDTKKALKSLLSFKRRSTKMREETLKIDMQIKYSGLYWRKKNIKNVRINNEIFLGIC